MIKTWIAANWKLNKTPRETDTFFTEWSVLSKNLVKDSKKTGVIFFPPATSLETTSRFASALAHTEAFSFGSQNCYTEASGAFTGEVSATVVKDMGGEFILIGHSERRTIFNERDGLLAQKLQFVQKSGLCPMFCVGETLIEREGNKTAEVLIRQIHEGLSLRVPGAHLAMAYEPVWAIGTGKVASLEQVAETHALIQSELVKMDLAATPILYGGSVKADNAGPLSKIPNVNGFLVGGASLDPKSFAQIVAAAQ